MLKQLHIYKLLNRRSQSDDIQSYAYVYDGEANQDNQIEYLGYLDYDDVLLTENKHAYDYTCIKACDEELFNSILSGNLFPIIDDKQNIFKLLQNFLENLLPENMKRTSLSDLTDKVTIGGLMLLSVEKHNRLQNKMSGILDVFDFIENKLLVDNVFEYNLKKHNIIENLEIGIKNKKVSLSGAQNKTTIFYQPDNLNSHESGNLNGLLANKLLANNLFTNYILKLPNPQFNHINTNEQFFMNMMKNVISEFNVKVADIQELKLTSSLSNETLGTDDSYSIIKRFDYHENTGFHYVIDGCQALGIRNIDKYNAMTTDNLNKLIGMAGNQEEQDTMRKQLFYWIVFNVLIDNDDNHMKNLSFYYNTKENKITLTPTPFYDVLSTGCYFDFPNNPLMIETNSHANAYQFFYDLISRDNQENQMETYFIQIAQDIGFKKVELKQLKKDIAKIYKNTYNYINNKLQQNNEQVPESIKPIVNRLFKWLEQIGYRDGC